MRAIPNHGSGPLTNLADPIVPCCDICDPTLLDQTRPPPLPPDKRPKTLKRGEPDLAARQKLYTWRETTYIRDHPTAQYDDTGVLQDELIDTLISHGSLSPNQVAGLLKDKWVFWRRHGADLSTVVHSLDIKFKPLPAKTCRTAKKDSSLTLPHPPEDTALPQDPLLRGAISTVLETPLPVTALHPSVEAQSRAHHVPSFSPPPMQLAARAPSYYPPFPSQGSLRDQGNPVPTRSSQPLPTPSPRHGPSRAPQSYSQYAPSLSASTMHMPHGYDLLRPSSTPRQFHAPHPSHVPAPTPASIPSTPMYAAHSTHTTSTSPHHLQASLFLPMHPQLPRVQSPASHQQPITKAHATPGAQTPSHMDHADGLGTFDYHHEYMFCAFQSQTAPTPPMPSAMLLPSPPPPPSPPASQHQFGNYSDHYASLSRSQYEYPSETQYDTTYITNPPLTQAFHLSTTGLAPPSTPLAASGSSGSEYYTYYTNIPEEDQYMQY